MKGKRIHDASAACLQGSTGVVAASFECRWLKDLVPEEISSQSKSCQRLKMRERRFAG